ncbi:Uncharacterised protein [Mycobacteroides abscessus]|nr:Uncharacterised protein [Mycobacteroides abscessus]
MPSAARSRAAASCSSSPSRHVTTSRPSAPGAEARAPRSSSGTTTDAPPVVPVPSAGIASSVSRSVSGGAYPVKYARSGPGETSSPVSPASRACAAARSRRAA